MIGNVLSAFFLIPVLASLAGAVAPPSPDSTPTRFEHLKAHLMIELRPSEQIRAHSRTESTITTFASKLLSLGICDEGGGDEDEGGELKRGL